MFCPSCGRQNPDNVAFCTFCGKALPQKSSPPTVIEPVKTATQSPQKNSAPKARLSFTAVKAVITGLLVVGLILIVIQLYYPGVFPWN